MLKHTLKSESSVYWNHLFVELRVGVILANRQKLFRAKFGEKGSDRTRKYTWDKNEAWPQDNQIRTVSCSEGILEEIVPTGSEQRELGRNKSTASQDDGLERDHTHMLHVPKNHLSYDFIVTPQIELLPVLWLLKTGPVLSSPVHTIHIPCFY